MNEAKAEAAKIVAEARAEAESIVKKAEARAADAEKNAMTEIALAGKQAVAKIKSEIASMIVAESVAPAVKSAAMDPAFIEEMLLAVAKNWNGADSPKVELQAMLPEAEREKLDAAFGSRPAGCSPPVSRSATRRRSARASRWAPGGRLLHLVLRCRFRCAAGRVSAR